LPRSTEASAPIATVGAMSNHRHLAIPALVALALVPAACGSSDDSSSSSKPAAAPAPAPATPAASTTPIPKELTGTWVTRLRKSDAPPKLALNNPFSVTISSKGGVNNAAVFQISDGDEPLEGESSLPRFSGDQVTLAQEGCFVDGSGYKFYDNVYRYKVSGDTLRFTVVKNSCPDRHAESILTSRVFRRQG
jgi:hypothetical protein